MGCGDSYHAPLNAELAFEELAGLPCEPMTAMQFARYGADFLPEGEQFGDWCFGQRSGKPHGRGAGVGKKSRGNYGCRHRESNRRFGK